MLLMEYAKSKGILRTRYAKVVEIRDNGADLTILYKVDGQKYPGNPSARTVSREIAESLEVSEDGCLMSGRVLKKNNFWIWAEDDSSDEA